MMHMLDGSCGPLMIIIGGLSWFLGLGLVVSLIVLVWTAIGGCVARPCQGTAPRRQWTCREDRIIVAPLAGHKSR